MGMTPEGAVKHAVKKVLKEKGIWFFMPVSNGMGQVGIHDFVCCRPVVVTQDMVGAEIGVFMTIETKAPGKIRELTANQSRVMDEIREHAGTVYVVDDANQLKAFLESYI
jgi:hypothetical protein